MRPKTVSSLYLFLRSLLNSLFLRNLLPHLLMLLFFFLSVLPLKLFVSIQSKVLLNVTHFSRQGRTRVDRIFAPSSYSSSSLQTFYMKNMCRLRCVARKCVGIKWHCKHEYYSHMFLVYLQSLRRIWARESRGPRKKVSREREKKQKEYPEEEVKKNKRWWWVCLVTNTTFSFSSHFFSLVFQRLTQHGFSFYSSSNNCLYTWNEILCNCQQTLSRIYPISTRKIERTRFQLSTISGLKCHI